MKYLKPNLSILPKAQQMLWEKLGFLKELSFVLYGGTAIALQLGHRISVDFDFFSSEELNKNQLISHFIQLGVLNITQDTKNTLTFNLTQASQESVKVSFFGGITFGQVNPPHITNNNSIAIASLEDLLATKLKTILQRAEFKDYFDIVETLKHGTRLDIGLSAAQKMFSPEFQPAIAIAALQYFEDGDLNQLTLNQKNILIHAAKAVKELPQVNFQSNFINKNIEILNKHQKLKA